MNLPQTQEAAAAARYPDTAKKTETARKREKRTILPRAKRSRQPVHRLSRRTLRRMPRMRHLQRRMLRRPKPRGQTPDTGSMGQTHRPRLNGKQESAHANTETSPARVTAWNQPLNPGTIPGGPTPGPRRRGNRPQPRCHKTTPSSPPHRGNQPRHCGPPNFRRKARRPNKAEINRNPGIRNRP